LFARIYHHLAAVSAGDKLHVAECMRGKIVVNLSPLVTTVISSKFLVQ